jgi:hypothetical protein
VKVTHREVNPLFVSGGTMFVMVLFLFWMPIIGPLVAGFVGGRGVDKVIDALVVATPSGLIAAVLLASAGSMFGVPALSAVITGGPLVIMIVAALPLVTGAVLGVLAARFLLKSPAKH